MAVDVMTRPAKVKRSPERDTLAEAIGVRDAAAAALDEANAKLSDYKRKMSDTADAYYRAEEALDEAKEFLRDALRTCAGDEAGAVAHAIRLGRSPPREGVTAAEREYTRTKECLDLAKEGLARLKGEATVADDDHRWAVDRVRKAVEAVCHSRLPELVARAERDRAAFLTSMSILRSVSSDFDGVLSNTRSDEPVACRIRSVFGGMLTDRDERVSVAPWMAAREALATDPDAPLPT